MYTGVTEAVQQADGTELEPLLDSAEEEQQTEAAVQVVLSGAVSMVVYRNAIAAIPNSLDFRHSFLKMLTQFQFQGIDSIQQAILDSIHRDFGDTEESWDLRARSAFTPHSSDAIAPQVLPQPLCLPIWHLLFTLSQHRATCIVCDCLQQYLSRRKHLLVLPEATPTAEVHPDPGSRRLHQCLH